MSTIESVHIPPQTGYAFLLPAGGVVRIIAPLGEQVADVMAFAAQDVREYLSSGRTIDYNENIFVVKGSTLYSNRSRPMMTMTEDTAGRHDFLLTPCSQEMFEKTYRVTGHHPSCFENLATNLEKFGVAPDQIPTTLNVFMNVPVDSTTGKVVVDVPSCSAGDYADLRAEMDLVVGVTACSAEMSNNGTFKPIDLEVSRI